MEPIREYTASGFLVREFSSLGSTNDYLKGLSGEESIDRLCTVAHTQTGGKGRLGRKFFSPDGGLYLSALFKKRLPISTASLITPAAAVAVAEAIESLGVKNIGIKWVNDLIFEGKKICGILTETKIAPDGSALESFVVGIGVNLFEPEGGFPDEIKNRAGAVFKNRDESLRGRLVGEILSRLGRVGEAAAEKSFVESYRERSVLIGKEILVLENGRETPATALGIDGDCRLIVRTDAGKRTLFCGEVSLKIQEG